MKRRPAAFCGFVGLSLACISCGKPLSDTECNELLDHYVALLVRSDRPGTPEGELYKLQVKARAQARTDPAFHECKERVSRRSFECAMQAPNADRLEQCLLF
jgi:hypothetical protein